MKKIFLFALACCLVVAAHAQELPYSKYLKFSKKEFKTNGFKYNEYEFIITTDVEPWSPYLDRQAAKKANRAAKGKKPQSVEDMM